MNWTAWQWSCIGGWLVSCPWWPFWLKTELGHQGIGFVFEPHPPTHKRWKWRQVVKDYEPHHSTLVVLEGGGRWIKATSNQRYKKMSEGWVVATAEVSLSYVLLSCIYRMYSNFSFSILVFAVLFPIRPGKGLLSFGSFTYHGLWGYSVILGLIWTVPSGSWRFSSLATLWFNLDDGRLTLFSQVPLETSPAPLEMQAFLQHLEQKAWALQVSTAVSTWNSLTDRCVLELLRVVVFILNFDWFEAETSWAQTIETAFKYSRELARHFPSNTSQSG